MPRMSDDIYLGGPGVYAPNAPDGVSPAFMEGGVGPMGRVYIWDTVPLTLQLAGLASSQNPGSGASFTLTAGTGVTSRVRADGTTEYVLDVPRSVTITAAGANTATYRVTGYDVYGALMTQTLAAPSTSTVSTNKAFKTITGVTNINATAGTNGLTVGYGDRLGIPVRVTSVVYVQSVKWDAALAQDAGTFAAADTTDPATAVTLDVRGTYIPSSATNGARRLVMSIAVPGIGCGPQGTRAGAFGVTQV